MRIARCWGALSASKLLLALGVVSVAGGSVSLRLVSDMLVNGDLPVAASHDDEVEVSRLGEV